VLAADGYEVFEAGTCRAALDRLRESRPGAVVSSCRLPDGDALDLLARVKSGDATTPFVVLAEYDSLPIAVEALQKGAEQFLTKPVDRLALLLVLQRALEIQRARRRRLQDQSQKAHEPVDPFQGEDPPIRSLAEKARRVLEGDRPVLIRGETGTGKGVLAAWLHANSPRAEEGFVDLNCAGLTRELLESELFGHERGAFTGAVAPKAGLLEAADRGTLFLDEIGDVDLQVQPKLLKVLEEGRFRRLGDVRDRRADIWLIAATHQDLSSLVEQKRFRDDLYFRISTISLELPPLRERTGDIPALAEHFIQRIAGELGRPVARLSPAALHRLQGHGWPGNIRELRNVLERATLLSEKTELEPGDLGFDFAGRSPASPELSGLTLAQAERLLIERALSEETGNVARAAQRLGISRSSLYQRVQRHAIVLSRFQIPSPETGSAATARKEASGKS
jgi:DNA-binding NtrC family response regulator